MSDETPPTDRSDGAPAPTEPDANELAHGTDRAKAAGEDPIAEFQKAFARAQRSEPNDPTAVALSTATPDGRPSCRMVLLKQVDERGFVFFTNYGSRKAEQLDANPWAALTAYWKSLDQQIRIEGRVERVPDEESDAYFASRPRASQLGAWVSRQSEPLDSRARLVGRFFKLQARFAGRPIPRPEFWGGYRLVPERIELWWNQIHRLHDRLLYTRTEDGWIRERLYP